MDSQPLMLGSFDNAIVHIDGDAFFASCEQASNPELKGKPVVTGRERGIAASMSYEAKARGVVRGMPIRDIVKVCPDAVILPSDYETYSLLSKRFYAIVRRFTPEVEEYSIDECFADLTGLRRQYRTSYPGIAARIKHDLDTELGFTFSVGLAPNKVLAKVGSKWKKPSGLTAIRGRDIHLFLSDLPVEKIWGIGHNTVAFLEKHGIHTALQFTRTSEVWVNANLSKPFRETWQELNGQYVKKLETKEKDSYASIQKMKTFTPPSSDPAFLFAQLSKNIENACIKARRYTLAAKGAVVFVRTHDFRDRGLEVRFSRNTNFPIEIIDAVRPLWGQLLQSGVRYRSTGVMLVGLEAVQNAQLDLFGESFKIDRFERLFECVDGIKAKYGKHTLFLGSSFLAHQHAQYEGARGAVPERRRVLFKGETKRKRLGIPMFLGKVE
jgi:DNA polymerase-4/DNA polymerase V